MQIEGASYPVQMTEASTSGLEEVDLNEEQEDVLPPPWFEKFLPAYMTKVDSEMADRTKLYQLIVKKSWRRLKAVATKRKNVTNVLISFAILFVLFLLRYARVTLWMGSSEPVAWVGDGRTVRSSTGRQHWVADEPKRNLTLEEIEDGRFLYKDRSYELYDVQLSRLKEEMNMLCPKGCPCISALHLGIPMNIVLVNPVAEHDDYAHDGDASIPEHAHEEQTHFLINPITVQTNYLMVDDAVIKSSVVSPLGTYGIQGEMETPESCVVEYTRMDSLKERVIYRRTTAACYHVVSMEIGTLGRPE